jgi:hypothetical protein
MDSATSLTNSGSFGALQSGNKSGPAASTVLTAGGKSDYYVDFPYGNDGTNGRGYFTADPATDDSAAIFNNNESYTFEFFIKIGQQYSNSNPFTIFRIGSSGSEFMQAYVFAPYDSQPGKLAFLMSGTSTNIGLTSSIRVDDNAWHHIAIVHTASTKTDMYIDGTLNQTLSHGSFGQQYKIFDRFLLGKNFSLTSRKMPFCHQSVLVKTDILKKKLFKITYKIAADFDLFYRLFKDKKNFYYLDCVISKIVTGGISDKKRLSCLLEYFHIFYKNKNYCNIFLLFFDLIYFILISSIKKILNEKLIQKILIFKYTIKNQIKN